MSVFRLASSTYGSTASCHTPFTSCLQFCSTSATGLFSPTHISGRSNTSRLAKWAGPAELLPAANELRFGHLRTQPRLHRLSILHLEAPRPQLLLLLSPLQPRLIHGLTDVTIEVRRQARPHQRLVVPAPASREGLRGG